MEHPVYLKTLYCSSNAPTTPFNDANSNIARFRLPSNNTAATYQVLLPLCRHFII